MYPGNQVFYLKKNQKGEKGSDQMSSPEINLMFDIKSDYCDRHTHNNSNLILVKKNYLYSGGALKSVIIKISSSP